MPRRTLGTLAAAPLTALLLAPALLPAGTAAGQTVRGTIRDRGSDRPIPAATVLVLDDDARFAAIALADHAGEFVLRLDRPGDSLHVRVIALGYAPADTSLGYGPGDSAPPAPPAPDSLRLDVRLEPEPVSVEGVTATARRRANPNLVGFLDRLENGTGQYMGPQTIARLNASRPTQLLLFAKGATLVLNRRGDGVLALRAGRSCVPSIWIDGGRIPDDSLDPWVPAQWILGVEVYHDPQQAPARFRRASPMEGRPPRGAGRCPVILIWTYHGFGFGQPP